jgi:hypothetical protein
VCPSGLYTVLVSKYEQELCCTSKQLITAQHFSGLESSIKHLKYDEIIAYLAHLAFKNDT